SSLLPIWAVALFVGPAYILNHHVTHLPRYALDQDRLFLIVCRPEILLLGQFVSNLQIELLRVEFDHFSASQQSLSPSELAQSVLRFARQKPELATKRLETVANSASLAGKTIGFEAYKSLFNFLYVIEDFSSALKMFAIAKHSISKGKSHPQTYSCVIDYQFSTLTLVCKLLDNRVFSEEFQRAARAVTGSFLDPILVDTLFILFDSDGDGHLSYHEFIETIRARGIAGAQFTRFSEGQVWLLSRVVVINEYLSSLANCQLCSLSRQPLVHTIQNMVHITPIPQSQFKDPALRFSYWPRYVARLLRFRAVYRKELLGWKLQTEQPFERPDKKPNEYREDAYLPIWRFSEAPPWNIANRISEFPYPDTDWCVVLPDGKKVRKTLKPMLPEEQLIFKGDRVKILVGPDKGKVGLVSSVLKMRRMVIVDGLNYRLSAVTADDIRREELPLCLDTEIALVDPVDGKPCQPSWRYDDKGNRVRVSLKTGRIIPLPMSARILDDLTDPKAAIRGPKDTPASVVTRVTFNPANDSSKISFEEDLSVQFGLDTTKKPFPTFWY
ncbi:ribosomal protein L24, partial [Opisthorchis viverrini]